MKILSILLLSLFLSTPKITLKRAAIDDAKIVSGNGRCNKGWNAVNILNNSDSQYLTVTVQITVSKNGIAQPATTQVFARLAPKESRELGCAGCGQTTNGQLCNSYKVLAAIYVQ